MCEQCDMVGIGFSRFQNRGYSNIVNLKFPAQHEHRELSQIEIELINEGNAVASTVSELFRNILEKRYHQGNRHPNPDTTHLDAARRKFQEAFAALRKAIENPNQF